MNSAEENEIELLGVVEEERELGNDYYDGSGFFNYDDYIDWSNSAIMAHSCYTSYVFLFWFHEMLSTNYLSAYLSLTCLGKQ